MRFESKEALQLVNEKQETEQITFKYAMRSESKEALQLLGD